MTYFAFSCNLYIKNLSFLFARFESVFKFDETRGKVCFIWNRDGRVYMWTLRRVCAKAESRETLPDEM